ATWAWRDVTATESPMDEAAPRVSVVVPAFQASATIERCVHALSAQTLPRDQYEVIVVDDGSTDSTATRARQPGARVIRLARNMAPAPAPNAPPPNPPTQTPPPPPPPPPP